jgi:PhnB protein
MDGRSVVMQLSPYLNFNGQCEVAFRFYERCLGGKIVTMMSYADSPMKDQVSAELQKNILHATLKIGDQVLMGSDVPGERYQKPQGYSISLAVTMTAEAERLFAALSENGTVHMPLQKTFWAERFGMLVDQYGIPWMVNCGDAG